MMKSIIISLLSKIAGISSQSGSFFRFLFCFRLNGLTTEGNKETTTTQNRKNQLQNTNTSTKRPIAHESDNQTIHNEDTRDK
jgi:hypothetical protein